MKPFADFGGIISEREGKMMKKTVEFENNRFAAPEAAFEKYADTVYRLAFVRTKSKFDADDILQEVFLRYIKVWQKMESEEHVKAMLIRITVNCSNSLLTSNWFKKTEQLNETIPASQLVSDKSTLEEVLKLPQKYRTVIHLHYYMGYSIEKIANITSTKPATVKTQLSRGREKLKNALEMEDL